MQELLGGFNLPVRNHFGMCSMIRSVGVRVVSSSQDRVEGEGRVQQALTGGDHHEEAATRTQHPGGKWLSQLSVLAPPGQTCRPLLVLLSC